jgi:hypothetical protein
MDNPAGAHGGWQVFAIGSAVFPTAMAILGKLGLAEINSNLATLIRLDSGEKKFNRRLVAPTRWQARVSKSLCRDYSIAG